MSILSLRNVVKQYHNHRAVDGVSFDIPDGSIFGLLGPNGAGKTSLIRIITTITGADSGEVFFDGEKINANSSQKIGYMPEERGLYKTMKVGEQLLYLAQLRGMTEKEAKDSIRYWLEKFNNTGWWDKKIEELSKGMQQKIQFIATVMHKPKLLILDEPFTGLDPLNTNLIKEEIHAMNAEGTSIVFSTHRMEQVEEICKDIVLINQGKKVIEGKVDEIKETYKDNLYRIEFDGSFPQDLNSSSFTIKSDSDKDVIIQVAPGHDSNELLSALIQKGIRIKSFTEVLPTLNEIFIKQVEN